MNKIKYTLVAAASSIALALGFALPAAAAEQTTTCVGSNVSSNICPNVNIDRSREFTLTLGNCSAIITNNVTQEQTTVAATDQANVGTGAGTGAGGAGTGTGAGVVGDGTGTGTGGAGTGTGSNDQSNTATTTATGTQSANITFAPDCSTHNVTNVTNVTQQAASVTTAQAQTGGSGSGGAVLGAATQVDAPAGGVRAGAGGGALATSLKSVVGLVGSIGATGLGLFVQKRRLES